MCQDVGHKVKKQDTTELLHDFTVFSGHVLRHKCEPKVDKHGFVYGQLELSLDSVKFMIDTHQTDPENWTIHVQDTIESVLEGGTVYHPLTFPRLRNYPELRRNIYIAHILFGMINGSPAYRDSPEAQNKRQELQDVLGVPDGLDYSQIIQFIRKKYRLTQPGR